VNEGKSFVSALWVKVLIGFGLALLVARALPSRAGDGATPPVDFLLFTAALVTVFTTVALWLGLRRNLGVGTQVALYAVLYNAFIVLVKFALAPYGLYEVNQRVDLTGLFPVSDALGALWTASLVFLLYLGGYYAVYRLARARITGRDPERKPKGLVLGLVGGAYALAGAGIVLLFVFGLGRLGGEYVQFALASSVSILIAVGLAVAGSLAALAFRDVSEQAEIVGDAALLTSFFWLGLAFLALYHVLWVVYILAITAVWPLKVVVPK
jgi:hypothetical protein